MAWIELGLIIMQVVLIRLAVKTGKKDEGVVACCLALFILIGFLELILPLKLS